MAKVCVANWSKYGGFGQKNTFWAKRAKIGWQKQLWQPNMPTFFEMAFVWVGSNKNVKKIFLFCFFLCPCIQPLPYRHLAEKKDGNKHFFYKCPNFFEPHSVFVMMLQGWMMGWLVIQLALDKASSLVWLLLCLSSGWWWSKLLCNLV